MHIFQRGWSPITIAIKECPLASNVAVKLSLLLFILNVPGFTLGRAPHCTEGWLLLWSQLGRPGKSRYIIPYRTTAFSHTFSNSLTIFIFLRYAALNLGHPKPVKHTNGQKKKPHSALSSVVFCQYNPRFCYAVTAVWHFIPFIMCGWRKRGGFRNIIRYAWSHFKSSLCKVSSFLLKYQHRFGYYFKKVIPNCSFQDILSTNNLLMYSFILLKLIFLFWKFIFTISDIKHNWRYFIKIVSITERSRGPFGHQRQSSSMFQ